VNVIVVVVGGRPGAATIGTESVAEIEDALLASPSYVATT
jgi:hypothetical protein